MRRVVVDLLGGHRPDDADLVGDARDVREQVGDLLPRLAVPVELAGRPARGEDLVLELGELLPLRERLGERLAVQLLEPRLVVEALELRRPAGHAEVDHPPGLDRQVRRVEHAPPAIARPGRVGRPRAVAEKSDGSSSPASAIPPRP